MSTYKLITLDGLKYYHNKMIDYMHKQIELNTKGITNCPNCGAVMIDEICSYCGTHLPNYYKEM